MLVCSSDEEIVLSTARGSVVRQRVVDIGVQSRQATGVLIQKLDSKDSVINIVKSQSFDFYQI
jgi:DNA gyrase subunit A